MAGGRPRLSVHRSNKNISVQLIDDVEGKTLASASSLESALGVVGKNNVEAAAKVGAAIAERAKKAGVEEVLLRPWRFSVPRPRQGAGRCRPRRRSEVLRWVVGPTSFRIKCAAAKNREGALDDPGAMMPTAIEQPALRGVTRSKDMPHGRT
jgi:ribosomal protein L18